MNKRQAQRLLRAAKSVEESEIPEAFTMKCFFHGDGIGGSTPEKAQEKNWCGTPACVLGHYGSRPDLQRLFVVELVPESLTYNSEGNLVKIEHPELKYRSGGGLCFSDDEFLDHFGVTEQQAIDLFDMNGCGNAKTPKEAVTFIRKFVKSRYGSLPAV